MENLFLEITDKSVKASMTIPYQAKLLNTLRAGSFREQKLLRFWRFLAFFSRKCMPSKKVSGKFSKVIFAKTKLLTKIAKDFFSVLKVEKLKKKSMVGGYQYFVLRNCRQTMI